MNIRILSLASLLAIHTITTNACDVCGCATSMSGLGILPQFQKHFSGIRFQHQKFYHPNLSTSMNGESQALNDRMDRYEIWGRSYLATRWQLFYFVPYAIHTRTESLLTTRIEGIGDASVLVNYALALTPDSAKRNWKHVLLAGGGIKLPTGKYQQRDANRTMLPTGFQVGTGAYTLIYNIIHTIRYRSLGLNTEMSYRWNGTNEMEYRLGNKWNGSASLFLWKRFNRFSVLPNLGVYAENMQKDWEYGKKTMNTGGYFLNLTGGIDIYFGQVACGMKYTHQAGYVKPLAQPEPSNRLSFFAVYMF